MAAEGEAVHRVSCEEHGTRPEAFVCQHLASGSGLGFHWGYRPEDPDATCPDAWCSECQAHVRAAGGWNEQTQALADIRLVCDLCYERIRERNWLEDPRTLEKLIEHSVAFFSEQQSRLMETFRLGQYERYDWDQEAGQLVFSDGGRPRVIADVAFVGSVSTRAHTWLWSWANPSVVENVKGRMREVRRYGEAHRLLKLAAAHWSATERDGWMMMAIACYLLGALGGYRSPGKHTLTFMVMTRVSWAQ